MLGAMASRPSPRASRLSPGSLHNGNKIKAIHRGLLTGFVLLAHSGMVSASVKCVHVT